MPNNPQQGGFFTRYAGQNMSPVPAGYMESAAQEAAMYSNIGSSIANMYMKKQEFGLKEKEIAGEAASTKEKARTNDLTVAKIDAGDRKLEFDAWKVETELGLKADESKFKTFTDADKILADRYGDLNLKLADAKDQATKDAIVAEMNGISDQRGVISTGVSRYLKSGTFGDRPAATPPSVRTKRAAAGNEYDNSPGKGVLLPREAYIKAATTRPNPNSASSATNGAEGGEGSDDTSSPSESDLLYPQTTVPPNEPPKVVDGRPATIVAGKPDIFVGHFGTEIKRSAAITNTEGTSLVGEFEYAPSENRAFPGIVSLTVNDNLTSPENEQLTPENLLENQRTFRQMHVLKFILENNFERGVIPTKNQAFSANKKFNADKSPIIGRIQSAFALFDNDEAGLNNEANLRFNEGFKHRFNMSVDRFMADGDIPDASVGVRTQSRIPKMVAERNAILEQISEATVTELPENLTKDPTETDRTRLLAAIKKDNELFLKLSPSADGNSYKVLSDRISRARQEHDSLVKESDAWRQSKLNWVTQNKFGSEVLRGKLANINATIDGMESSDKATREKAQSFGILNKTWLGAFRDDDKLLSGWLSAAILNFPRTVVPDKKGRMVTVNPAEYLDWVTETKSYSDFEEVNASIKTPSLKAYEEAQAVDAEHKKLIGPLNVLVREWKRTGEKTLPQGLIDKHVNPETAAQENNVFAIMAAQRKPVTGGGNPSNFEQQMLLSGIPNPGTVFTFSDFSLYRLKTTALLSMLSHARMMQNAGMGITENALASYNQQYSSIFGRKITMQDFNRYQRFVNDRKGAYEGSAGKMTTEEARAMGAAGYDDLTDLVTRDFK